MRATTHFLNRYESTCFAAQRRRTIGDLELQIHFGVRREEVAQASRIRGQQVSDVDVANQKLDSCVERLPTVLQAGVVVRLFAWAEGPTGIRMHNRYVLSEVGGVAVQTGLDRGPRGTHQTDDLTILSREQHRERWTEYAPASTMYRLLADRRIVGA